MLKQFFKGQVVITQCRRAQDRSPTVDRGTNRVFFGAADQLPNQNQKPKLTKPKKQ
jgi:hypothetical protein